MFTVASERSVKEALVAAALAMAGMILFPGSSVTQSMAFFVQIQNLGLIAAATAAGYGFRTHQAYVAETERRAAEAERTREEEAARRVEEERVRIAREVHDITAHSLSAVSIQAAAAERMIDRDPAAAKEAISAVRTTAKGALADIRSMIGVLRCGDDAAETSPTSGTERLDDLRAYLGNAGIETTLDAAAYCRADVPAHVDMALFGIAREAATNIVRHAGARKALIRLAVEDGRARLVVEDDGVGCGLSASAAASGALPQAVDGEGHGIAGMAERVHLLGGTFSAGDRAGGGFRVVACLPMKGAEA